MSSVEAWLEENQWTVQDLAESPLEVLKDYVHKFEDVYKVDWEIKPDSEEWDAVEYVFYALDKELEKFNEYYMECRDYEFE